jgi:serine/threonine protein kinase
MTLSIPGYQILDFLEDGTYYRLHRGVRLLDQTAVTLKILDPNQVDLVSLQTLRYEAELSQKLRIPGVPLVLAVEGVDVGSAYHAPMLVLEALPGESLRHLFDRVDRNAEGFSFLFQEIHEILALALSLVETLGYLHEYGVLHRGLTSSNVFWDSKTKTVQLLNVGLAPLL